MDLTKLKSDLKRDEGYRTHIYRDSVGFCTIGVGHFVGSNPRIFDLTDDEIDALLDRDIKHAMDAVRTVFPWTDYGAWNAVEETRFRALVNMAFNRGERRMQESTTITPAINKAHETGDWHPVSDAILSSPWAKQIGKRAERLAFMLEYGKDPE